MNATVRRQCPVCDLANQKVVHDAGERITYDCSRCGEYTISRSAQDDGTATRTGKSAELSAWLRERNLLRTQIPLLTTDYIELLSKTLPSYGPLEKQNKLLKAIELLTSYPGQEVPLSPMYAVPLAWAANAQESTFYLLSLLNRGLIELRPSVRIAHEGRFFQEPETQYPVLVTSKGWEHLEREKTNLAEKTQAFVAMSFDNNLMPLYDNAIAPAIDSTGYRPYRVDIPHLERIDAKIIAEIKNSRFVVADVTQQKQGVYYEAGFAHGLGIPVIWSVHRDEIDDVHFDTRQYRHILWETEDELKEELRNTILATIGQGKKRPT